MSVAELEGDGVVSDAAQSGHDDPGETTRPIATPPLAEDVHLTHVFGARGEFTEQFGAEALLPSVFPADGDEITDDLKVSRRPHGPNLRPTVPVASRERMMGRP